MTNTETQVRMVGHLLLAHPTTGTLARNRSGDKIDLDDKQASCFCFVGACWAVSTALLGASIGGGTELAGRCSLELGQSFNRLNMGYSWDSATDAQRTEWATKLANYKENV